MQGRPTVQACLLIADTLRYLKAQQRPCNMIQKFINIYIFSQAYTNCAVPDISYVNRSDMFVLDHVKGRSNSCRLNSCSEKYLARTVLPPKYRPSSSRTVFQAPAGPANKTKMRTAWSGWGDGGWTRWTITRSTVPFLEHSSP